MQGREIDLAGHHDAEDPAGLLEDGHERALHLLRKRLDAIHGGLDVGGDLLTVCVQQNLRPDAAAVLGESAPTRLMPSMPRTASSIARMAPCSTSLGLAPG